MNKKTFVFLLISTLSFIVVFTLALMIGQYKIPTSTFFNAIFSKGSEFDTERSIILSLRLPRTLIAALSGCALSLSGLLFQEVFQNKLTSPDLLGVSSGSAVGAATAFIFGLSSVFVTLFSFIAGIVTVVITLFLSKLFKNESSITLVLAGIVVGGFMSASLSLIKYFADPTTTLSSITYWLMGSYENATMKTVIITASIVIPSVIILIILSWRINIVALGKEEAQTKGLNYSFYKYLLIGLATLLTATSVAFNGSISWVGLVIPHLVRLVTGRETRRSIPLSVSFGSIFMVIVDIISRTFTKSEIPLSAVTGLLGTVIFVSILISKRKSNNAH